MTAYGGDGNDILQGSGGPDVLYGEKGSDTIRGGDGSDVLDGGEGDDSLEGGAGDDILLGRDGNDVLKGDAGKDFLVGGRGNDNLSGGDGADDLHGNSGQDTLSGDADNDFLLGGDDPDSLSGGTGQDTLEGGRGVDTLDGGLGADTIYNPQLEDVEAVQPSGDEPNVNPVISFVAPAPLKSGTLTSVAGSLTTSQATALKTGLAQFASLAGSIGVPLPIGEEVVGKVLGDIVQRGLVRPISKVLGSTSAPTINAVLAALQNLPTSTASSDLKVSVANVTGSSGSSPSFSLRFQASRTSTTTLDNLGASDQGIQGSPSAKVPLTASLVFDLTFGIGAQGFFVRLPVNGFEIQTDIDSSGFVLPLSVGLLAAQTEDGTIRLNARTKVTVKDANGDGQLTSKELTVANTTLSQRGSLRVELPFQAQLGARTEEGVVTIVQDNLSDTPADGNLSKAPSRKIVVAGPSEVQQLAQLNASVILQWLNDLGSLLDRASSTAQLAAALPFTQNLKLNEVADLAGTLRTQVINRLVNPDGTPNFRTATELVAKLTSSAGPVLGLDYDAGRKEIVFRLNFGQTFSKQAPLALGVSFPRLADVRIDNPQVQLQAAVSAGVVFGVSLAPTTGSVLDRFFLRDASSARRRPG